MEKILISGCLQGNNIRWNGSGVYDLLRNPIYQKWQKEERFVGVCPELLAGYSVPRPPAEIQGLMTGGFEDIYKRFDTGEAKVLEKRENGFVDVTEKYIRGAYEALKVARKNNIRIAILTDGSPSCGSREIYDGTFGGTKKPGSGVLAVILSCSGIRVFNQNQLEEANKYLAEIEQIRQVTRKY